MSGQTGGGADDRAREQLARRVTQVRFTPVRLREGYAMDDVDTLLEELTDAARTGRALSPLVDAARFATVRFREGYDMGEVDRFLAEVAAEADGVARPAPSGTTPTAGQDSVTTEQRGLLARLRRR